ncbi:MAG: hypothetical protein WBC44_16225 [Planctomycetaceae bacterium]
MTRPPTAKAPIRRNATPSDAWLFDEPDLDEEGLALLAAYRAASEASRRAMIAQAATAADTEPTADRADESLPAVSRQPGVLRLHSVAGVRAERFTGLHGQLLAAGYLTADVLGRTDGLSYRVTREGLQRLSGESHAEAA